MADLRGAWRRSIRSPRSRGHRAYCRHVRFRALLSVFHFTVSASDFERSLAFYQRLGFQLLRDNRDVVWPQFVADNFGLQRAQGRGSLLALGDGEHQVRIDLIEWLEPRLPEDVLRADDSPPRIVAIRTGNVLAAYEALRARGSVLGSRVQSLETRESS